MLLCEDEFCAYYKEDVFDSNNDYCSKHKNCINLIKECTDFELPKTCDLCRNSFTKVYETGTIDDIEYYCKLQNNKLIYDDLSPYTINYVDFPKCNIDSFERI